MSTTKPTPGPEPRIEVPDYDTSFVPRLCFGHESFRVETWTGDPIGLEACKDFNDRIDRLVELRPAVAKLSAAVGIRDSEIARLKADKAELVAALQASLSLITDDGRQGGEGWTVKQARALIAKHSKPDA